MQPIPTSPMQVAQAETLRPCDDLRAIIDGLSDALIVVGIDQRIEHANRVAQQRSGRDESIVGQLCHAVFQCSRPCESPDCECLMPTVLATGEPVRLTHRRADAETGETRYIDVVASPMQDSAGVISAVIEVMRDVTEERQLEEALVRRHEQLSILNAISNTVNQSLDLRDILGRALDEVLRLTGVDIGAIFLCEETLGNLELFAHRGLSEEAARMAAQFGMLDSSCGGVIDKKQVVVVPNLSRYRGRRARSLRRERLSTLVHVPLVAKGAALGSMCVGTRTQREFDPTEQALLTAIGNQIAVAIDNARLYAEVQHKEFMRCELLKKVITAQEEKRKRIARELHDDTSQALTALLYAAEEAMEVRKLAEVRLLLKNMRTLAQRTLDGVHKVIFDLRPTMLDHLGLIPAVRWLAESRLQPAGMRVTIVEAGNHRDPGAASAKPRRLPPEVETCLFRVVQEAISNIARHALARNVQISLNLDEDLAEVTISDDGIGFDVVALSLSPDSGRGLGLMGMRERVMLLGGEMEIDTAPGYGTRITVTVPTHETRRTHA